MITLRVQYLRPIEGGHIWDDAYLSIPTRYRCLLELYADFYNGLWSAGDYHSWIQLPGVVRA